MKTIPTLAEAQEYFQQKGFLTNFELTSNGLWDKKKQCFYTYDKVNIVECVEVKESKDSNPNIRIFGLLVSEKIKGLFIEIILIH